MIAILLSLANDAQKNKFNKLYEQYKELVKFIALDILKNDRHAEEAAQETFLRLFLKIDDIGDIIDYRTHGLVVIISRRVCFNKLKYEKRRAHEPEDRIANISLQNNTTEDIAIKRLEQERIFRTLGNMSKEDFELFALRHYYGYAYEELEDFFDSSASSLRKRYQRFRRKILEQYGTLRGDVDEQAR